MPQEPQAIEVEVVEIDGHAPPIQTPPAPERARPGWQDWQSVQGRILKLDKRWWPLWVVLGTVAVVLFLTLGLIFAVIFVIFRILRGIARAIFG